MDQQAITKAIDEALEQMKGIVQSLTESADPFTQLALVVATKAPVGGFEVDIPIIFAVKPECINPPCNADEFEQLLLEACQESGAVAVVRAHGARPDAPKPRITVETRGKRDYYVPTIMLPTAPWAWGFLSGPCQLPILPSNRSN